MKQRFSVPIAVFVLVRQDGKLLFQRRLNTGHKDGELGLPAGHKEAGETLQEAVIRETREEIGIELRAENLRLALIAHRWSPDREMIDAFFEVSTWDGKVQNREPHKCSELVWLDLDQLPPDVIDYIAEALAAVQRGDAFAELGWRGQVL